jgi:hypothetical protein
MANCPIIKITQQNQLVKLCFRKKPGMSDLSENTRTLWSLHCDQLLHAQKFRYSKIDIINYYDKEVFYYFPNRIIC